MNSVINIFAVGDIMLGNQDISHGFGVTKVIEDRGIDFLFTKIKHIFQNGDIVFGNLEAPLSTITNKSGFEAGNFLCDPKVVEGIKNSYINFLSVANNHIMQHGEEAFNSTINTLKSNKITPIGAKNEIVIFNIKNLNIAFAGYSFIEDRINNSLYNKINSAEQIVDDISKIRSSVDFIIISLHWGIEYTNEPSPLQIEIGRLLVDKGADLILGSHAHVIQSYEIYKNKPIIYGLGNFIFDDTYIPETQKSVIFNIVVDLETKEMEINFVPVFLDPYDFCPKVATGNMRSDISKILLSINSKITDKSINEYTSFIGDYSSISRKNRRKARMYMKYHFLKNIYRYPVELTLKTIIEYVHKN